MDVISSFLRLERLTLVFNGTLVPLMEPIVLPNLLRLDLRLETLYRRVNDDLRLIMNFVDAPALKYIEIPIVRESDEISHTRRIEGICSPSQLSSLDLSLYDFNLGPCFQWAMNVTWLGLRSCDRESWVGATLLLADELGLLRHLRYVELQYTGVGTALSPAWVMNLKDSDGGRVIDSVSFQLLEARGRSESSRVSNIRTLVLDFLWYTPTEVEGLNSAKMEVHIRGVQLSACDHLGEHWGDAN
jgi:hypothetical protein